MHLTRALSSLAPLQTHTLPAPICGHIAVLTLSRPSSQNALNLPLATALHTHLAALHAECAARPPAARARALILASSTPGVFCAGADLRERAGLSLDQTRHFLQMLRGALGLLAGLPIPTFAAIDGPALGGGFEIALATHVRLGTGRAVVGLPETGLGVLPGAGGTWRLRDLVGRVRAREMVMTGRKVGAQEAERMGIMSLVEGEDVMGEAVGIVEGILRRPPLATEEVVRVYSGEGGDEVEAEAYERLVGTRDRDEALRAWVEKRRPVFEGR